MKGDIIRKLYRFGQFFSDGFIGWLYDNWHIMDEFCKRTHQLIHTGKTHYSARTIIEVMSHDSIIDAVGAEYKISNAKAPDLARAFVIIFPKYVDFWEYRRSDWRDFKNAVGNTVQQ